MKRSRCLMLNYWLNQTQMTKCQTMHSGQCLTKNLGLKSNHLNLRSSNSCKNSSKIQLRGNIERMCRSWKIHNYSCSCMMKMCCTMESNNSWSRKSCIKKRNCSCSMFAYFSIYHDSLQYSFFCELLKIPNILLYSIFMKLSKSGIIHLGNIFQKHTYCQRDNSHLLFFKRYRILMEDKLYCFHQANRKYLCSMHLFGTDQLNSISGFYG